MKRLSFMMVVALVAIAPILLGAPYAAQLTKTGSVVIGAAPESVDIFYRLNQEATAVSVQVYGPLPSTTVVRTIAGGTDYGVNSVQWDGKNDASADCVTGNYKFKVFAEDNVGFADWTNITATDYYLTAVWSQQPEEAGAVAPGSANGNEIRGLGFDGADLIIAGTNPRMISRVSEADGTFMNAIPMTIRDLYGVGGGSYDAWLGPYDCASTTDGDVYIGAYRGAGFPISRISQSECDATSGPVSVALGFNSRALDVVNEGQDQIMYISNATGGAVTVYEIDPATSLTTRLFIVADAVTSANGTHVVIGKDGNTLDDAIIWVSSNDSGGKTHRFVKSGGTWTDDASFDAPRAVGGDYVSIGGTDCIIIVNQITKDIDIINGDTGAVLATFVVPIANAHAGGNGDVTIDKTNADSGIIYYGSPDKDLYGKLSYGYGDIGSAQYYSPQGVTVVYNQANDDFGRIYISNATPLQSGNAGAESDEQGVYSLYNDMTWFDGSCASSLARSGNDPANHWDPADSWSPRKLHIGDDSLVCLGDSGTYGITDDFYLYYPGTDPTTTATAILVAAGANHGRLCAGQTYTSGTTRVLYGIDRDGPGDVYAYAQINVWEIGATLDNYLGAPSTVINSAGASNCFGGTIYTMKDMCIGRVSSDIYLVNRRWSTTQLVIGKASIDGATMRWQKTAADIYAESGSSLDDDIIYAFGVAEDEARGRVASCQDHSACCGEDIIIYNQADGSYLDHFQHGGSTCNAIAFDPAGNILTASSNTEHVRMWSPPGTNNYTTDAPAGVVISLLNESGVLDWMLIDN